jgi:pSer/pThr/pTyr-binding forkhead associated (FHA) protein
VVDESSYNGCFVNGRRVREEQDLAHGDLVQLGDYRLELFDLEARAREEETEKTSTLPGKLIGQTLREQPDRLVMLAGPAVGVPFPLMQKRVVVGRGEECDLPINDTSVSRVHAEILGLGDGRYEIVDLDSSNGVRVNGVELKRGLLDAGDIIELGDVQLKFVPAGAIFAPSTAPPGVPRRNTLEPGVDEGPFRKPSSGKLLAFIGVAAVVVVVIVVATRPAEDQEPVAESAQGAANPAAVALDEAKVLLDQGEVEDAIRRVQDIPEDSNLRESAVFREIQAKWADRIFAEIQMEPDKTRKKALLDLIAKSPDVGSVQRKRAATEIAALEADSVDVSDLPSAAKDPATAKSTPHSAPSRPAPPKPVQTPAPSPPQNPGAGREVKGGLVRDTPF